MGCYTKCGIVLTRIILLYFVCLDAESKSQWSSDIALLQWNICLSNHRKESNTRVEHWKNDSGDLSG